MTTLHDADAMYLLLALLVLLQASVWGTRVVGVNTFSLHGMYGNRLVRAYLGASRSKRNPHPFTGFDPEDNVSMTELRGFKKLMPIVNLAINIVKPSVDRLEWQERKAASFTVTPWRAGCAELGYQDTDSYADRISLGRAMTISGAAASPSMGYHTSPLVALVMTLFNVRLGWWLPNPGCAGEGIWKRGEPLHGFGSLLTEAFSGATKDLKYVYLSDGGHFENLGLYELVRRRCHLIVVSDASCDPEYEYKDLQDSIRKIRVDFGIPIVFGAGLPGSKGKRPNHRHYAIGRIEYSEVDIVDGKPAPDGYIIYIKPVLTDDVPVDVAGYAQRLKNEKSPFPHQSTTDQFFDESQFESYRSLGYHSVTKPRFFGAMAWKDDALVMPTPFIDEERELDPVHETGAPPVVQEIVRDALSGAAKASLLPALAAIVATPIVTSYVLSPPPSTPVMAATALPIIVPLSRQGEFDGVSLPYFREAARCGNDPTKCEIGVRLHDDSAAVRAVQTLSRALIACASSQTGTPTKLITVQAYGYASSTENRNVKDPKEFNRVLANERAREVTRVLQEAITSVGGLGYVKVANHFEWRDERAMSKTISYIDNVEPFSSNKGALTRRVDLKIDHLGWCTPQELIDQAAGSLHLPQPLVPIRQESVTAGVLSAGGEMSKQLVSASQ